MNLELAKWVAAGLILLIALIAGIYPFKLRMKARNDFSIGEALASGVFLGAGLLHMLPDSTAGFNAVHVAYPMAFLLAGITFLVLLWLEHLGRELSHHGSNTGQSFALLATLMLSVHSFLAGTALGLSADFGVFVLILVAILAHKWAASFALAVIINKHVSQRRLGFLLFGLFVVMTPVGILLGDVISTQFDQYTWIVPSFTAIASGTFIYLGTLHGLDRGIMVKQCCNMRDYSFVILGFSLMALVAVWA